MIKNTIISGFIIYLFSRVPGWAVEGMHKFALCAILTLIIAIIITELEYYLGGRVK